MPDHVELEFRKASRTDINQLAELRIRQLIDEGYPETADIRSTLIQYFSASFENGSLICWVGLADEMIVATAGLCFYQLPPTFSNPSGNIAYVTNMYTADAYRRRGIAARLLGRLLEEAKALDYSSVRLHASHHGRGLYERAGFSDADGYMHRKL